MRDGSFTRGSAGFTSAIIRNLDQAATELRQELQGSQGGPTYQQPDPPGTLQRQASTQSIANSGSQLPCSQNPSIQARVVVPKDMPTAEELVDPSVISALGKVKKEPKDKEDQEDHSDADSV